MKAGTFVDNELGRVLRRVNSNIQNESRKQNDFFEQATQVDCSSPNNSQSIHEAATQLDFEEIDKRKALLRANTIFDVLTQSSPTKSGELEDKPKKRELESSSDSQPSENQIIGILESLLPEICDVYIIPGREISIGRRPQNTVT